MRELDFLQVLVNQQVYYGLKSPDTDLYDIGFKTSTSHQAEKYHAYALHAVCRFKVIWRNQQHRIEIFYEDTPCEKFLSTANRLLGLKVKRVALSNKNDLWLDLDDCWVVFATFENDEESWRIFASNTNTPHLVASNSWLRFHPM